MAMPVVGSLMSAVVQPVVSVVAATLSLSAAGTAQLPALLFTGSHPFVSRDAVHERPGGAINQLTEYDFTLTLPDANGSIARTLMPATAMHCYLGDADFDGNFLLLLVPPLFTFGAAATDGFGYATVSIPNPNPGGLAGFTMLVQGLGFASTGLQLSSPVLVQLQ